MSKLPDDGLKIRRQINELDEKLTSAEKGATEVICLDDVSTDMESVVL